MIPVPVPVTLSAAVGCVGGIYGIGGGSILAPVLIGSGRNPSEVAPDWPTVSPSAPAAWSAPTPARASRPGCPMS